MPMTDEAAMPGPETIEKEPCYVVLLNGRVLELQIRKGSWPMYLKEVKADGGIFTMEWAVPWSSIMVLARGNPYVPTPPVDVSGRPERLN